VAAEQKQLKNENIWNSLAVVIHKNKGMQPAIASLCTGLWNRIRIPSSCGWVGVGGWNL